MLLTDDSMDVFFATICRKMIELDIPRWSLKRCVVPGLAELAIEPREAMQLVMCMYPGEAGFPEGTGREMRAHTCFYVNDECDVNKWIGDAISSACRLLVENKTDVSWSHPLKEKLMSLHQSRVSWEQAGFPGGALFEAYRQIASLLAEQGA